MVYYIVLSLFILTYYTISANTSQNVANETVDCDDLLEKFSVAISNFTYCSLLHAKPITMCENCADSYFNITEAHGQLTKTEKNGTTCINNFINLDRLQIVNSIYKNSNDLWNRAKCFECIKFVNGSRVPTKIRKNFDNIFSKFLDCTEKYNHSTNATSYCNMCINDYIKLNKYYFSIGDISHGIEGLCMDIVDLMNKTQAHWSKTCCQYRVKNEFVYIVTTVFMGMVPVLFYILVNLFVDVKRPKLLPQNRFAETMNTQSTSFRRSSESY